MKKRRDQLDQLKTARAEGKIAYFKGPKLIIKMRNHPTSPDSSASAQDKNSTSDGSVSALVEKFTPGPNNVQASHSQEETPVAQRHLRNRNN